MRLLVILHESFGANGGIAKFNRDLLTALADWPAVGRLIVLQRDPLPPGTALPARIEMVAGGSKLRLGLAVLRCLLCCPRFDAILCGHLHLLPLAWLARLRFRAPLAAVVHGIDAWQPTGRSLSNALVARLDAVFSVSRLTLERLSAWSGLPGDRGRLLPNCIDLGRFTPGPPDAALAARYGLAGKRVVMTLGRLAAGERYKGVDELLAILPRLRLRHPDLVYLVAGDGPDRARLEAKAGDLGLAEAVVFAGFVAEADKASLYRLADAFVLCGHGEGFGIVLLEAMACGVPVVASLRDGSREAVADGRLGLLADPDDPDSLTAAVETALARPKERPDGLEVFSYPAFAGRVRDLVDDLARHESL
ncbi:Glycosyltransferase involved in cell wall bisynthesis [Tistlia consotensis]|uniref:Glycosyltransferase involved in cell wall bisynthesis n=1 Tax=Tistlia consotensis USBA 355 TaxID=560819 RepID=A0A1Y6CMW0_9PROT|nr:glycosyltransferase family 4 protein [Tistlia consotensis]SMF63169.1 Glycosyltransferase involved in cell wall bisynthesis [Tistlia consotensis USBA 355]SNR95685.1 Glycosyltransferase involved in cell wall bisynthesis [Tistlia consotensis]